MLAMLLAGCGAAPPTDIMATVSEDVGRFYVRSANSNQQLTGHVCVEESRHEGEIVKRLVQQLASHSYRSVTLEVYSEEVSIARYRWSAGGTGMQREPLQTTTNPCAGAPQASFHS